MPEDSVSAASPATILDPSGGSNQVRVRAYNERLVMSLVRRHGALSKAEIARRSGLSAQTVTVIMRALEADGLLIRGEPTRGRVGQPSTPMRLTYAEGAPGRVSVAGDSGVTRPVAAYDQPRSLVPPAPSSSAVNTKSSDSHAATSYAAGFAVGISISMGGMTRASRTCSEALPAAESRPGRGCRAAPVPVR